MKHTARMGYADTPDAQIVEIPYRGRETTMLVVLSEGEGRAGRPRPAADGVLLRRPGPVRSRGPKVALELPKFTFTSAIGLGDALVALGMEDAFDPMLKDAGRLDPGYLISLRTPPLAEEIYAESHPVLPSPSFRRGSSVRPRLVLAGGREIRGTAAPGEMVGA